MTVLIQSRSGNEEPWRDECSKRNHFKAYLTALARSRVTGRVYRLVTRDGDVLEQVSGSDCRGEVRRNDQSN
jgi:hypothetical protein